jgi:hypothetical protein
MRPSQKHGPTKDDIEYAGGNSDLMHDKGQGQGCQGREL